MQSWGRRLTAELLISNNHMTMFSCHCPSFTLPWGLYAFPPPSVEELSVTTLTENSNIFILRRNWRNGASASRTRSDQGGKDGKIRQGCNKKGSDKVSYQVQVRVWVLPGEWLGSNSSKYKASQRTRVLPPASHSAQNATKTSLILNAQLRQIFNWQKPRVDPLINPLISYSFNMCTFQMDILQRT